MRYPLPWFPLSDDPSRCSCRTTRGCRLYRSSRAGCRFGRSGSSGFVVGFRRLQLSNRGLVLKARRNLDRRRYRYICRLGGLLVTGDCLHMVLKFLLRKQCQNFLHITLLRKLQLAQIIVPNTLCHNLNRQFPQTHLRKDIFLLYLLELGCLLHRNLH